MASPPALGSSEYQRDCEEYYRLLRSVHSATFTSPKRKEEELSKTRYTDANVPGIRNLGSLIDILHRLLGDGPQIHGIDYGCGSHWFVDHVHSEFGWSAVGYDPDPGAIDLAHQQFPASADSYRRRDPLRDGLPEDDGSQDFVFCNAVIQHFADAETESALAEMSRVLRPGGYCQLIFKAWLLEPEGGWGDVLKVLDAATGKVMFLDPTMQNAIAAMPPADQADLDPDRRAGWRLLHLFSEEKIIDLALSHGMAVASRVGLATGEEVPGSVRYRSGKGLTTSSIFFVKA